MSEVPTNAYRKLLRDSTLSDFCITTNGYVFKVHKVILAAASEFSELLEAQENRIDFPADPPTTIARVILYLYTGEYSSCATEEVSALLSRSYLNGGDKPSANDANNNHVQDDLIDRMKVDIMTHQCADKLDLEGLASATVKSFRETLAAFKESDRKQSLAVVVDLILETTVPDDIDLRQHTIKECVPEYEVVEKDESLLLVIKKHEFIAWTTARRSESWYRIEQGKADSTSRTLVEKELHLQLKEKQLHEKVKELQEKKTELIGKERARLEKARQLSVKTQEALNLQASLNQRIRHRRGAAW